MSLVLFYVWEHARFWIYWNYSSDMHPNQVTCVGSPPLPSLCLQNWTIKKSEHRKIDAFELWCWRRLLSVPWTARRSSQLILKEINPKYSLEGLMLKLNLQYFGHLVWRVDLLKKTLILGKIEGRRRRGWQRMRWLNGIISLMDMSLIEPTLEGSEWQQSLVCHSQ